MKLQHNPYKDVLPFFHHPYGYYWPDDSPESDRARFMIKNKLQESGTFWDNHRKILEYDIRYHPCLDYFRTWASVLIIPFCPNIKYKDFIIPTLKYSDILLESWIGVMPQHREYLRPFNDFDTSVTRCINMTHLITAGIHEKIPKLNSITELGGGYGDMALLCRKLGFKGTYTIFDFPEVHKFQDFYLKRHGFGINLATDVNQLTPSDLVIATWSLTEMSLGLRNQIYNQLKGSKNWLIVAQPIFGFDNYQWLDDTFKDYKSLINTNTYEKLESRLYFYSGA